MVPEGPVISMRSAAIRRKLSVTGLRSIGCIARRL
jgi:hypothetical protein